MSTKAGELQLTYPICIFDRLDQRDGGCRQGLGLRGSAAAHRSLPRDAIASILYEVFVKIVVSAQVSARRRIIEAVFQELLEGARLKHVLHEL